MATPSEIIGSRDRQRLPVSDRIHNVADTTQGLTDELYNTQMMRTLGNTAPAYLEESDWEDEPNVPTLDAVLSKLGVKADDDPTGEKAARKFVEDFSKKQASWKKKVERDPSFGKRGWNTVVDLFKQTSNDLMNADIQKERYKAMHDGTARGFLANLMFPRVTKAGEEGRDYTPGELGRDIFANALYAVPFGGVARAAAPASKVLQFGSQAAAPVIVAGVDKAADPNYTWSDAALDASIGTAANLGVNKWLAPKLGQLVGTAKGGIARKVPQSIREALEDNPTTRDVAQATVEKAKQVLNAPVKSAGEMALEIASGATKGVSAEEKATAQAVKDIYDASKAKVFGNKPSDILKALAETQNPSEMTTKEVSDMVGDIVAGSRKPFLGVTTNDKEAVSAAIDRFKNDSKKYSEVLKKNPELLSLFFKPSFKAPFTPANMAKTYVVNQIGSSDPDIAKAAVSSLTLGNVDVDKARKSIADEQAKSDAQGAIGKILSASPDLTDEDQKYLRMVEENPDVLKFSQDDGLKQWLLRRGHSILQGTPAHRPLWEVR